MNKSNFHDCPLEHKTPSEPLPINPSSSQTIAKPNVMRRHDWECNACGFREYTDAVSQDDLDNWLQCSNCGENEFHLVPVFDDAKPIVKRSSSPIEKLLLGSVGCVKCGASYGKCDCWYKCKCGWLAEKGCKCSNENCV